MARVLSSSRLEDDRGREFPTVRIAGTQVWDGRDQAAELPGELAEACAAAVKKFQGAHFPRWWGLAFGVFVIWGLALVSGSGFGPQLLLPLLLPALMFGFIYIRRNAPDRRPFDERVLATLLAAERCASCGYSIASSRCNQDGTRTCPECGSSWRVPDVKSSPLRRPGVPDPLVSEAELPVDRRLSYVDGRGRAVWLVDPAQRIVPARWAEVPETIRQKLVRGSLAQRGVERFGSWCLAGIAFGLGALQLYASTRPGRGVSMMVGLLAVLGGIVAATNAMRIRTARNGQSIAQLFLQHWLCPSCASRFMWPQEEPDGCVSCSRCHAAWRVKGAVAESPGFV